MPAAIPRRRAGKALAIDQDSLLSAQGVPPQVSSSSFCFSSSFSSLSYNAVPTAQLSGGAVAAVAAVVGLASSELREATFFWGGALM